tara:strand:+ start:2025 stop:3083 length:1059 start_codon:yes stop_codon:yes gene_type:complete
MARDFKIAGRSIGLQYKPFIIAEMSGNHNQSLERALDLVDAAAEAGADAIKLQTYTADTITLNIKGGDFQISDSKSIWNGQNLYDLYQKAYTPWSWHQKIFDRARELGIICFSSPFDESAVDFLEEINTPAYKIASFENNHLPLIRKVSKTGKPLIISTGMSSLGDIEQAVKVAIESGCSDFALLKCTSTYPASPINTNLKTISSLREIFKCEIGLSDHTKGIGVALASISLQSTIIEKHFTLSRDHGGVDSEFSIEPHELRSLVIETQRAWESIGNVEYGVQEVELKSKNLKRSIYASEEIEIGEPFTPSNIRIIRPGKGAHPQYYDVLIGKQSPIKYKKGQPIIIEDLIG